LFFHASNAPVTAEPSAAGSAPSSHKLQPAISVGADIPPPPPEVVDMKLTPVTSAPEIVALAVAGANV
jgi:hypothetical protein